MISKLELFVPKGKMNSEESAAVSDDFGFAFNDSNFSDRVLKIEILPDIPAAKADGEGCSDLAHWASNRKRRRQEDIGNKETVMQHEEQILNCNMPDTEDGITYENQDEDAMAVVDESPAVGSLNLNIPVDEGILGNNAAACRPDYSTVIKVKTIHISSPILAAKSPFFYKLFANGTRESEQRQVTVRVRVSEEAALMDLLNFMYSNTLLANSPAALLDVLMAADKFEVASCMRYCSRLLTNLPMTRESALLYLDLPSSVSMGDAVQSLTEAAKRYLAITFKDISKFQEEMLKLPFAGIEAVLSSDELQVASEDVVYDFVLKWARMHYPKLDERREVLGTRLGRLIRFPYMTCRKLKKVQACVDFDSELATKVVLEALFFKAEAPYRQRSLAADEATYHRYVERAYKYRPVKVMEFELPRRQCIVYFDLKREECAQLFPAGRVYSQAFHLGGQGFFLSAHCNMDQLSSFHCFGLFLGMQEKGSVSFAVDYEFAARSKPEEEYNSKYKGNYTFTGGKAVGYRNLFAIPWTTFMDDDSAYFINGVLHLRAELTIRH